MKENKDVTKVEKRIVDHILSIFEIRLRIHFIHLPPLLHQVDADEISETVQTDRVAFKEQLVLIGLCGRQVSVAACGIYSADIGEGGGGSSECITYGSRGISSSSGLMLKLAKSLMCARIVVLQTLEIALNKYLLFHIFFPEVDGY